MEPTRQTLALHALCTWRILTCACTTCVHRAASGVYRRNSRLRAKRDMLPRIFELSTSSIRAWTPYMFNVLSSDYISAKFQQGGVVPIHSVPTCIGMPLVQDGIASPCHLHRSVHRQNLSVRQHLQHLNTLTCPNQESDPFSRAGLVSWRDTYLQCTNLHGYASCPRWYRKSLPSASVTKQPNCVKAPMPETQKHIKMSEISITIDFMYGPGELGRYLCTVYQLALVCLLSKMASQFTAISRCH